MLRNNQNKQNTNRNSTKFVQISTFLIPHIISSVCFGCFYTDPKHQNKPIKNFLVSWKTNQKNNQNRLSFGSNWEKKINSFEDFLIENVFWRFFWFVLTKFCLFRLFRYQSETPKQTEKNVFLVLQNKPKNNRNRLSFGLFRFEPKRKFDCFEDTLGTFHCALCVSVLTLPLTAPCDPLYLTALRLICPVKIGLICTRAMSCGPM
jgi:hypothetical protein